GGEGRIRPFGEPRRQRAALPLVERVGAEPESEEERGSGGSEPVGVEVGRQRGADRDIAQVPRRVGRVQKRQVVAPAARREGVEGGPRLGHRRRPQTTTQPPRLSPRAATSSNPASRKALSSFGSGQRASKSR